MPLQGSHQALRLRLELSHNGLILQEKVGVSDEQLDSVDAFVAALAHSDAVHLPSDLTMDPARTCTTLAMVQAGISGPQAATAGLGADDLMRRKLSPDPAKLAAAADAIAAVKEHFPAAAAAAALDVADTGATVLEGGTAQPNQGAVGLKEEPVVIL